MADINWEQNILGMVSQADWLDVGAQVPQRQNDPIDGLFSDEKTPNLLAQWQSIASEFQIPVMAHFHGFDTEANTTFRVPIDNHNIEKGLLKVKINQSERLRALIKNGVQGDQELWEYVINDGARLADQIITRTKVAKNELMATGKVSIKENGLNLTVDYGVPAENVAHTLDVGDGASDDLVSQIQSIIDAAIDEGVIINGIFTSRAALTKIRKNASLQTAINGTYGAGSLIRQTALEEFLNEEFGIQTVITNDLTYGASAAIGSDGRPDITSGRYYPKDKVTFFAANPAGKIGAGLWGDPPEADNYGLLNTNGNTLSPYVYITQWMEKDPAVLWTKASALFMPVLYNPNSLFIAAITETASV